MSKPPKFQQRLLAVIKAHENRDREPHKRVKEAKVTIVPHTIIRLCDYDTAVSAMLSNLIYWCDKCGRKDGWAWKSVREWTLETGLHRRPLDRAARILKKMKLIKFKKLVASGSLTMHYRLDQEALMKKLDKVLKEQLSERTNEKHVCKRSNVKGSHVSKRSIASVQTDKLYIESSSNSKYPSKTVLRKSQNSPGGDSLPGTKPKVKTNPYVTKRSTSPKKRLQEGRGILKKALGAGYPPSDGQVQGQAKAVIKYCFDNKYDLHEFVTWTVNNWGLLRRTLKRPNSERSRLKTKPSLLEINAEKKKGIGEAFKNRTIPKPKKVYTKDNLETLKRDYPNRPDLVRMVETGNRLTMGE